jgi:hypothetical protein
VLSAKRCGQIALAAIDQDTRLELDAVERLSVGDNRQLIAGAAIDEIEHDAW